MLSDHDLTYHRQRARTELDRAHRASHSAAIEAHLTLARLHMERLREEDEACGGAWLRGS
jgi:hypothetical protein